MLNIFLYSADGTVSYINLCLVSQCQALKHKYDLTFCDEFVLIKMLVLF